MYGNQANAAETVIATGAVSRSRAADDNAMRATDVQNQARPRPPAPSTRSPTAAAERSGAMTSARIVSARRSLRTDASRQDQSFEQALVRALGLRDGADAARGHREIAPGPSTALRRRIAVARRGQPLLFEAVQRRVEGAGRRVALRTLGNLPTNGHPIRIVTEAQDGQQHNLLELAEGSRRPHQKLHCSL